MKRFTIIILTLFSLLSASADSPNEAAFKEAVLNSQYDKAWDCYSVEFSNVPNDAVIEAGILYVCIKQNNLADARCVVDRLEKLVPRYLGMYTSVYSLYINTCINELNLNIGREDALTFLKIYENEPLRVRAKKAHDVAEVLASYHDYKQAVAVLDFIRENKSEIEPTYYYRFLYSLSQFYNYCQNPQMAYVLQEQCAHYYRSKFGTMSKNYAKMLSGMAYVARFTNKPSLELLLKVDSIYRESELVKTMDYAINLDNIGASYSRQGNFKEARKYCEQAYDLMRELEDVDSLHVAITINNIGSFVKHDDYQTAKSYFLKSISIYPTVEAILNLALIYEGEQDYEMAHDLYAQLSDYNRMVFSNTIANHLAKSNRWDEYYETMSIYMQHLKFLIKDNVSVMPENDRPDFLEYITNTSEIANLFEYAFTVKDDRLASLCYDYLLMTKSLLLQFKDNIHNIVVESSDEELLKEYNTLKIIKINVDKGISDLSLYKQKEFEFLEKLKAYGAFVDFIDTKCYDIASCLSESEVSVEFFLDMSKTFSITDVNEGSQLNNSALLYAVCLTKDSIPVVVNTKITREQLLKTDNSDFALAKQIYNALFPVIHDAKKVFFSASDFLHIYPLESYTTNDSIEFVRLSSTRELCIRTNCYDNQNNWDATLIGGLTYDMSLSELEEDAIKYPGKSRSKFVPSSSFRVGARVIEPLPGTKHEVKSIESLFVRHKQRTPRLCMDIQATEAYIKSLSGNYGNIIHFATHGFYDKDNSCDGISSLFNSGLLLSGASYAFSNEGILPDRVDDGILSSHEISRLNMRNVNLAVLSTCDSGLGTISHDGVFGLQRGFKLAGVKSILMSLWKVDDDATCKLMTEFYSNWIGKKMTKHQALEVAKRTVRETKGWEDPKYWAAFILLDGLD